MSTPGSSVARRWLALYPRAWRERYGDELITLIADMGGQVTWQMRLNLLCSALAERIRVVGAEGRGEDPARRVRSGVIAVLWAWTAFVPAGILIQKTSEHWQQATPGGDRGASAAFTVVVVGSVVATLLISIAIAGAAPALCRGLRHGGWARLRRRVWVAGTLSVAFVAVTAALVVWAHGLSPAQRDGRDGTYAAGFVAWGVIGAIALASWTAVAATVAEVIELASALARLQSRIAGLAAAAMVVMTAGAIAWYVIIADRAPAALTGGTSSSSAPISVVRLVAAIAVMSIATVAATAGARRAITAAPAIS